MKYRVIREAGSLLYYPQMKRLWWWQSINYEGTGDNSLEEALADIEEHKRIFSKPSKVVVWRSDD